MSDLPVGRVILVALLALFGFAFATQLPEIRRYLKVRSM
jgi:hypothetical protein